MRLFGCILLIIFIIEVVSQCPLRDFLEWKAEDEKCKRQSPSTTYHCFKVVNGISAACDIQRNCTKGTHPTVLSPNKVECIECSEGTYQPNWKLSYKYSYASCPRTTTPCESEKGEVTCADATTTSNIKCHCNTEDGWIPKKENCDCFDKNNEEYYCRCKCKPNTYLEGNKCIAVTSPQTTFSTKSSTIAVTSTNAPQENNDDGINVGAIVGPIAVVIVIGVLIAVCYYKREEIQKKIQSIRGSQKVDSPSIRSIENGGDSHSKPSTENAGSVRETSMVPSTNIGIKQPLLMSADKGSLSPRKPLDWRDELFEKIREEFTTKATCMQLYFHMKLPPLEEEDMEHFIDRKGRVQGNSELLRRVRRFHPKDWPDLIIKTLDDGGWRNLCNFVKSEMQKIRSRGDQDIQPHSSTEISRCIEPVPPTPGEEEVQSRSEPGQGTGSVTLIDQQAGHPGGDGGQQGTGIGSVDDQQVNHPGRDLGQQEPESPTDDRDINLAGSVRKDGHTDTEQTELKSVDQQADHHGRDLGQQEPESPTDDRGINLAGSVRKDGHTDTEQTELKSVDQQADHHGRDLGQQEPESPTDDRGINLAGSVRKDGHTDRAKKC